MQLFFGLTEPPSPDGADQPNLAQTSFRRTNMMRI